MHHFHGPAKLYTIFTSFVCNIELNHYLLLTPVPIELILRSIFYQTSREVSILYRMCDAETCAVTLVPMVLGETKSRSCTKMILFKARF